MKNYFLILMLGGFALVSNYAQAQRIFERGLAERIPDDFTGKKLALHRSIPPGTIVLVKNVETGASVRVKVVSKLPNIGANSKIIIKLSEAACKALNATGLRFSVEIRNAPQKAPEEESLAENTEEEDNSTEEEEVIRHEVSSGETLYSISRKYKVDVADIKDWNNLEDNTISVGQILTIFKL